jgi:VWFA-related protein
VLLVLLAAAAGSLAAQTRFRSTIDTVSVDVSVKVRNIPVLGLTAADFRVYDNNVLQKIEAIEMGSVPIDATLFLDTSGSVSGDLEGLKSDIAKIAAMLRSDDRLRLLVFDDQIRDVFGWRAAGSPDLGRTIRGVGVGTISSVYDGILLAMLHRPDPDRRHLIVAMTDGVDAGSVVDSATLREVARRAESVLHVVQVGSNSAVSHNAPSTVAFWRTLPDANGFANLDEAVALTGGRVHKAPQLTNGSDVVGAFRAAFDDFRQCYLLRYTAGGVAREGWHELRVELANPGRSTVRARPGYFGG